MDIHVQRFTAQNGDYDHEEVDEITVTISNRIYRISDTNGQLEVRGERSITLTPQASNAIRIS